YLVICLDNNNLKNRLNQNNYIVTASLESKNIFYSNESENINTQLIFPDDFNGGYYHYTGPMMIDGEKQLTDYLTYASYKTNDKFYIRISDKSAYKSVNRIIKLYIIILLIVTIVPALLIMIFTSLFSKRITILKSAMHQASMGDYNIIDTFEGSDDELAETFHDLKVTVDMIHEKESMYYLSQINEQRLINKQQQMEYNMLASQINPHFLYNTLETIRMQALTGNTADVITSIKLLGKSMRYVLDNTGNNSTTLDKELEHVQTYLTIQHIRFGERVNWDIIVSDACNTENIRILPLLLQPIVENSIVHGLEEADGRGMITINIDLKDDLLNITIKDNGIGMDSVTLERLRTNMEHHASNAQSIGLYNINQRIKLFYGEQYMLAIDSIQNVGTVVTLKIPSHL
ncbi:MAG: sensor histidine kinase, partial [Wujia sp.]